MGGLAGTAAGGAVFCEYGPGYYSAEGERKAALEALNLSPDWIFSERDLAAARANSPGQTLQAILCWWNINTGTSA